MQYTIMDHRLLFLVLLLAHSTIQDCTINITDVIDKFDFEPLYLKRDTLEFIYPRNKNDGSKINVKEETEIVMSCGAAVINKKEFSVDGKTILAKCNSKSQFEMNGTVFKVGDVGCFSDVMETVTNTTKTCANGNGEILDVSYPIDALQKRVPLYEICFDFETKNVFYSKFVSPKLTNKANTCAGRLFYQSDDDVSYYNLSQRLSYLYIFSKESINQQVGLPAKSEKYFPRDFTQGASVQITISQETLSHDIFFFFCNQQRSVTRYMNTVPIWDIYRYAYINNWDSIRYGLHRFTIENNYELEIYTGTYGVTTLPHEDSKNDTKLYLYKDGESKAVPLAKLLWRLVYRRETKQAIVFIVVNNPWVFNDDDKICKDISWKYGWDSYFIWDKYKADLGYGYACAYEDFKKTVNFLPDLEVDAVLNSSSKTFLSFLTLITSLFLWWW